MLDRQFGELRAMFGKERPKLAAAVGHDLKGKASMLLYVIGIATSFLRPWIALVAYVAVALMWLVPDRRIEALERKS